MIPLFLGILMWARASHRVVVGLLSTVVIGSTFWMYYLHSTGTSIDRLYYGTDTRIAEVMVGVLLAVVMHHRNGAISERVRQILSWAGWLAILVLGYMWTNFSITESFAYRGGFLLNALLTSLVIMAIISRRGIIDRVFNWPPAIWVGVLAYGLYIYHFVIFLWLTPERTGLDPWPNLALRLAVTFLFAWTSHRFLEMPILKGATFGLPKAGQLMLYPVVGLTLIGIASLTANTGGADPLATLRDDGRSQRAPVAAADGVLDILVIHSAEHAAIVDELEAKLADDPQIRVSARSVFSCDGGWVDVDGSPTCANWASEWPALIAEHDPDSIVFFVDDWAGDDISKFAIEGAGSKRAIGRALLGTGFDILTSQGASVSQIGSGQAFATAFARALSSPFYQSLADLSMRPDVNRGSDGFMPNPTEVDATEYLSASADVLLELAVLYQRADRAGMPRVLIIGDSQARSLGYGFERWGVDHGIWVWNAATNGCGIADEGYVYYWGENKEAPLRPECITAVAAYKDQVARFEPDLVLVLSSAWDIGLRRLDGWPEPLHVQNPEFKAYLTREYREVAETLTERGAKVVWMQAPCVDRSTENAAHINWFTRDDLDTLNLEILPSIAAEYPDNIVLYDLDEILCPSGEALGEIDGISPIRGDGVHFGPESSGWFAETYGPSILEAGGLGPSP